MKKYISPVLALVLLMTLFAPALAGPFFAPDVTEDMCRADYWLLRVEDPDEILLTELEIKWLNAAISADAALITPDIRTLPGTYDLGAVLRQGDSFFPEKPYYISGREIDFTYFNAARENIGLPLLTPPPTPSPTPAPTPAPAIPSEATPSPTPSFAPTPSPEPEAIMLPVRYGIATRMTDVKWLPLSDMVSTEQDIYTSDDFQFSSLFMGEPVLIEATSRDGAWYYVRLSTTSGWARAEHIAVCEDRDQWLSYINAQDILVVTADKMLLDADPYTPAISEMLLGMGTKLPLATDVTIDTVVDGRLPYNSYVVVLPTRGSDGECVFKNALIPFGAGVSNGYLPYTPRNLMTLLFEAQGDRYGWGGLLHARDCSAYVLAVYRCFGIDMPRNSARQAALPAKRTDFTGMSDAEKAAAITRLSPGALLYFKGHIMNYLGEKDGELYVISDLGSVRMELDQSVISVKTTMVNTLDVHRASGNTWLTEITAAMEIRAK